MKNYAIDISKIILIIFCSSIIYACSSHKDTAGSRAMQNLTSRYNYMYNANLILNDHQQELTEGYSDNYDEVLPVYVSPEKYDINNLRDPENLPEMEEIIKKAQVIILEKSYGNYVDDAYILLGKANFYKSNYFNATEYFDYAAKTYPDKRKNYIHALDWKARSLMQLGKYTEAKQVLDTLSDAIYTLKRKKAEPLATIAQIYINQRKNPEAINTLTQAIKAGPSSADRVRWTYILAQLSEEQKNYAQALQYYRKVERSNAPFEMYFNANLNRIRLNSFLNGTKLNRQDQLLALLKDDKNLDYHDQIYYQIAETYLKDEDYQNAEKYYNLSIRNSFKNRYQKGLSYLKIADLNFKHFRNYIKAKVYYDSTVITLPRTYPGFNLIEKKNQNLQYLTDRYTLITREDTLQTIAKLPEDQRSAKIQALAKPVVISQNQGQGYNSPYFQEPVLRNGKQQNADRQTGNSSFYFANTAAISRGYNDFKRKWGNRQLEENWRQSVRSSAQITTQDIKNSEINNTAAIKADSSHTNISDEEAKVKDLTASLPITPELLVKSDQKIIDAYFEIANFYLQELDDYHEASEIYEILLKRFPNNDRLPAIYYGLFLVNKKINPAKSAEYSNKILKDFPLSTYAKIIKDPSFSLRQSELETAINKQYNELFGQYARKEFATVIQRVNEILKTSPGNYLSPQFAYLKAIAIGRTNNVDSLQNAFKVITDTYKEDLLIVPLVKNHQAYIDQHLAAFKKRKIALIDFDPTEPRFFGEQFPETPKPATTVTVPEVQQPVIAKTEPQTTKIADVTPPTPTQPVEKPAPVKVQGIFSTAPSDVYYYVIDVADASLTLSSSRFGIGQFNRGNHAENNLRHQLKEFDNDQLIFVGNFGTFDDAKTYASGIDPQLKQIMKVPANLYISFIISKENFEKLSSKELLDKYLEFYKNNY